LLVEEVRRVLTLGMTFGLVDDIGQVADQAIDALGGTRELREQVHAIGAALETEPRFGRARDLARVAHGLADMGDQEAVACLDILRAVGRLAGTDPGEVTDTNAEGALRDAFAALAVAPAGNVPPRSRELESIVISAAQTIGAQYGSLFLVDQDSQELVFEVSLRERLEELRRFRLPLGRGIAGLVAVTGQPIALSDVASDPRHAADIAEQTGYTPKNMLCVPLQSGERIVGVLELLDKHGDAAFSLADMEALGAFASQAAQTIAESNLHQAVVNMLVVELRRLAARAQDQPLGLLQDGEPPNGDHRRALEIGRQVRDISDGDPEVAAACGLVLRSVRDYARAQSSNSVGFTG
jgi:putative methionine-R-sulfoxide reductase with GAF domain